MDCTFLSPPFSFLFDNPLQKSPSIKNTQIILEAPGGQHSSCTPNSSHSRISHLTFNLGATTMGLIKSSLDRKAVRISVEGGIARERNGFDDVDIRASEGFSAELCEHGVAEIDLRRKLLVFAMEIGDKGGGGG